MTNNPHVREWTGVPAYAVAGFVAKGERLAKTAAKLGVPAPVVTVTNRRVRKIHDDILGDTGRTEVVADVTLVTTLTKKMAEELTDYLLEHGLRVRYLPDRVEVTA